MWRARLAEPRQDAAASAEAIALGAEAIVLASAEAIALGAIGGVSSLEWRRADLEWKYANVDARLATL